MSVLTALNTTYNSGSSTYPLDKTQTLWSVEDIEIPSVCVCVCMRSLPEAVCSRVIITQLSGRNVGLKTLSLCFGFTFFFYIFLNPPFVSECITFIINMHCIEFSNNSLWD